MSFFGHREIFRNDPGATLSDYARAHRPDESPVGCSSAACSPASPASALPTGSQCALNSSCWSTDFHRTANCVLTVCLTPGGRPTGVAALFLTEDEEGNVQNRLEGLWARVECPLRTWLPSFTNHLQAGTSRARAESMLVRLRLRLGARKAQGSAGRQFFGSGWGG
jgi:hypothetical protein